MRKLPIVGVPIRERPSRHREPTVEPSLRDLTYPIGAEPSIPADNRYDLASGLLAAVQAPIAWAQ